MDPSVLQIRITRETNWNWDLDLLIAWLTTMRMLLETVIMNLVVINSESTCDQKHANVSAISPRHFLTQLIENVKNEEYFTIADRFIETRRRELILSKLIFHRKKNQRKYRKWWKLQTILTLLSSNLIKWSSTLNH